MFISKIFTRKWASHLHRWPFFCLELYHVTQAAPCNPFTIFRLAPVSTPANCTVPLCAGAGRSGRDSILWRSVNHPKTCKCIRFPLLIHELTRSRDYFASFLNLGVFFWMYNVFVKVYRSSKTEVSLGFQLETTPAWHNWSCCWRKEGHSCLPSHWIWQKHDLHAPTFDFRWGECYIFIRWLCMFQGTLPVNHLL